MRKIQSNVDRDKKVNEQLKAEGWKVLRFWEHEVRKNPDNVIKKITETLEKANQE
jgi:DNA mismatch endonuclease (patch repair protein)